MAGMPSAIRLSPGAMTAVSSWARTIEAVGRRRRSVSAAKAFMRQRARPIQNNRNALDNRLGADVINARISMLHSVHDRDNAGRMPALGFGNCGGDDALGAVA